MNSDMQLRRASQSDFDALYAIYMDETVNPFLSFEVMEQNQFKDIFHGLMNSGELLVLEKEQQVAATCIVVRNKRRINHVVTLTTLATNPKFHRQGIGAQFMQMLFKKLRQDGIKRVDLYVEADNLIAQGFYKKVGFQLEGVMKNYVKRQHENHYVDEQIMALMLD